MDDTLKPSCPAEANKDDWHGVTDARKRKVIQDRLAQRARRKRLREAKNNAQQTLRNPEPRKSIDTEVDDHFHCNLDATSGLVPFDAFDPALYSQADTLLLLQGPAFDPSCLTQAPSLSYEVPYQLTLVGALFINGQILGINSCVTIPTRSSPASPDVPLPLRPTATQLLTMHSTGIDAFPFPKMRDNVINLGALIDDQEFTYDLVVKPSFSIMAGATPWDPRAWKVEKPFAEKWGHLFY
ncbi:hypothetical protein EG329_004812 [Mollisiaceae sp. DMI_Dod_QoI]|nr:hypothetical protein EG329_004812 [Helotiales sp. DMI_Dod_QoI]